MTARKYSTRRKSDRETLGPLLTRARFKLDVAQSEMARTLGVTRGAVWQWENDANVPRLSNRLFDIGECYRLPVVDIALAAVATIAKRRKVAT